MLLRAVELGLDSMIWLVALAILVVGGPLFIWTYARRLGALNGPWIWEEARHD